MKRFIHLTLAALACATAFGQGRLVALDSSSALVELNPTTGARTPIVNITGAANVAALAYDRQLDILYGASLGNDSLYTINMVTGAATLVGAFNAGHDVVTHGLEFDNSTNTLYMASALAGTFYSVNRNTGQATLLGTHGITSNTSLGYNSNSNLMYAINSGTDSFYSVNRANGAMTLIGALGGGVILPNALAFNHDTNIMYMTDTSTDMLYTVNMATGAATSIGSTAVGNLQGLAYINPVPEPGSMAALAIGLAALATRKRRKA